MRTKAILTILLASLAVNMLAFTCSVQHVGATEMPAVHIDMDKFEYSPRDDMWIAIHVANPTEEELMFRWYWGVPELRRWVPVFPEPIPIPPMFERTVELGFVVPYLGEDDFGCVFYVQLTTVLTHTSVADAACWAYNPDM